jgi:hypothetical protein
MPTYLSWSPRSPPSPLSCAFFLYVPCPLHYTFEVIYSFVRFVRVGLSCRWPHAAHVGPGRPPAEQAEEAEGGDDAGIIYGTWQSLLI